MCDIQPIISSAKLSLCTHTFFSLYSLFFKPQGNCASRDIFHWTDNFLSRRSLKIGAPSERVRRVHLQLQTSGNEYTAPALRT